MASEDKSYCGTEDRSHVDQGTDTQIAILSQKLSVSIKDILEVMSQNQIGVAQVEEFFHNKQNAY